MKLLEVSAGTSKEAAEPCREGEDGLDVGFTEGVVRRYVQLHSVGAVGGSVLLAVPRYGAIFVKLDPFGLHAEAVAEWDAEMGYLSIVCFVSVRGCLVYFFVVEDAFFELIVELVGFLDELGVAPVVSLDGLDEARAYASEDVWLEVGVIGEGILDCSR